MLETPLPGSSIRPTKRSNSFPRKNRLTEREQFIRLFEKPGVYRGRSFQAFWKVNDIEQPRLGITIKGRLGSIWRMRLKRIIREWFRIRKALLGPNDVNIVVKAPEKMCFEFLDSVRDQLVGWKS